MKKYIIVAALSLLTALAFSAPAMAGDVLNNFGNVILGAATDYDLSNSVYIDYIADNYSNAQTYSIGTVHSGGNRKFVTTSETSVIWWQTCSKGTQDSPSVDTTSTTGDLSTSWSSL